MTSVTPADCAKRFQPPLITNKPGIVNRVGIEFVFSDDVFSVFHGTRHGSHLPFIPAVFSWMPRDDQFQLKHRFRL